MTTTAPDPRAAPPNDTGRPVLGYIALVTAGTVPFWIAGSAGRMLPVPVDLPVSALMVVCPLGAAIAYTHRRGGWSAVGRLLRRAVDLHKIRPARRYVPIVGLLPAVAVASYAVQRAVGQPVPPAVIPVGATAGFLVLYLVSTACEQLGWTAYATDALLERHDALTAALTLGVVWAAWHVIGYAQAGRSPAWIFWQCVFTVALRVVMTSAYLATNRSVAATILMQTSADLSWSLYPTFGSHYDPAITGMIMVVVAAAVTLRWGRRTLAPAPADRRGAREGAR